MFSPNSLSAIVVGTVVANSGPITFWDRGGGRIYIPADSSITTITWYDGLTQDGTFYAAYDEYGTALVQTVAAGKSYEIPLSLSASPVLKAVGNAAGTIDVATKG